MNQKEMIYNILQRLLYSNFVVGVFDLMKYKNSILIRLFFEGCQLALVAQLVEHSAVISQPV